MPKIAHIYILLVALAVYVPSTGAAADGVREFTENGAISFDGKKFTMHLNRQPGNFTSTEIGGDRDLLLAAVAKTSEIAKKWEEQAAGGLFNPLSLSLKMYPDGLILVSFQ